MKPLVGITSDYDLERGGKAPFYFLAEDYVRAIAVSGGIPLILPHTEDGAPESVLDRLDALVISGGDFDIDPQLYGESQHPQLGKLNPQRTEYELCLLRAALAHDMPLLGICGGLQLLNVALKGSLYQHLPDQLNNHIAHEQQGKEEAAAHNVTIEPKSLLYALLQVTDVMVNSTHHQGIKKLGEGLKATAWAPDGLIEAVEHPAYRFVLGVQWHPEALINNQPLWIKSFERLIQKV